VLQYLVTSKVRRRLLVLLWADKQRGAVGELAERAGVAFAGAHAELKAMQRAHLAVSRQEGRKEIYSANLNHPDAKTLRALVTADAHPTTPQTDEDQTLKQQLVGLGAPLRGVEALGVEPAAQLTTLVRGASLARRDAVVARTLPLCFWRLRDTVDVKALAALTSRAEDKHALGFFLELTGELGGDRRLVGLAESLRDRRMTSLRDFFPLSTVRRDAARDFALATKWGFRINMDLESFRSLFEKFVPK
jgi:hypothetical protein